MVSPEYFIYLMQFFYSAILERGLSVSQRISIVRRNKNDEVIKAQRKNAHPPSVR